jgi:hypothetical protein
MKLNPEERAWSPADHPEYLIILRKDQQPPTSRDLYLFKVEDLLIRLAKEANEEEIENANGMMQNLPDEEQLWLPTEPWGKPEKTAHGLMFNPASEGSNLHDWKWTLRDLLEEPLQPMEAKELAEELEGLSLESCLSRFL